MRMEYTHPKKNNNFHGDKNDESQLFIGHTTIFLAEPPGAAEPADWGHGGSLRSAVTVADANSHCQVGQMYHVSHVLLGG